MVKKQRSKSQERKSKRPRLKENSIQIKLEMSRKEINCSFAYACIFHLQCGLHHYQCGVFPLFYCTTPIFICFPLFFPVSVWSQSHFAGPSIPIPCHARPFFHFSTWPVGDIFTIFTVLSLNFFLFLAFSAFVWVSIFVGFSVHFRAGIAFCRFQYAWLLAIWPSTLANWIRN